MKPKGKIPKSIRNRTPEHTKVLNLVRRYQSFVKMATGIANSIHAMGRDGLVNPDAIEELMEDTRKPYRKQADLTIKDAFKLVKDMPIYTQWLKHVDGVGENLATQFIALIQPISDFDTVSKLWAYAGLAVFDGHAQRRVKGKKSNWNPELKRLCYQLGDCFVKQGTFYRTVYDNYKARDKAAHPKVVPVPGSDSGLYTPGHMQARAIRYAAKMFLSHLWLAWREIENLPIRDPYPVEKMNHSTVISPWAAIDPKPVAKKKTKAKAKTTTKTTRKAAKKA